MARRFAAEKVSYGGQAAFAGWGGAGKPAGAFGRELQTAGAANGQAKERFSAAAKKIAADGAATGKASTAGAGGRAIDRVAGTLDSGTRKKRRVVETIQRNQSLFEGTERVVPSAFLLFAPSAQCLRHKFLSCAPSTPQWNDGPILLPVFAAPWQEG